MNELISRVQAACANQPGWLRKKRQLAAMLLTRFSTMPEEKPLVTAWQKKLDTHLVPEGETTTVDGLVDLPLFEAVKQYPAMCQENLMEKGLSWQASQLNAMHLALLNGGRFLYLANDQQINSPVELSGDFAAANYHTLIIVGSNCQLTIKDQRNWQAGVPLFSGLELLVGTNSTVSYLYNGHLYSPVMARLGMHVYQAHGAQVRVIAAPQVSQPLTLDLQSNLDGDGSLATLTALHSADNWPARFIVGVNEHRQATPYRPHNQAVAVEADGKLVVSGAFVGDDEL
ncbi:hypothetical protein [uncultured Lentilactobacillus sp.]|uniref:hypothetical protein n=1 Tax=uncultured Lentilactobacillus sp. TaxID=2805375 RepID=UPI00259354F8|nr:hypothetical protein [uncultured Lentilactobacillus sp.]